jgi:hypothetical protein
MGKKPPDGLDSGKGLQPASLPLGNLRKEQNLRKTPIEDRVRIDRLNPKPLLLGPPFKKMFRQASELREKGSGFLRHIDLFRKGQEIKSLSILSEEGPVIA